MPAKSKAQFRLMAAAANNPSVRKKMGGISKAKAEEFVVGGVYGSLPEKKKKKKK